MKSSLQKAIVILLTLFSGITYSQSISFNSPINGQTIQYYQGASSSETTIPVFCSWGYTISPYPPKVSLETAIILETNTSTYDSRNGDIPQWFYLTPGTYTWTIRLLEFFMGGSIYEQTAHQTITFIVKHTLIVQNNFLSGVITVDGSTVTSGATAPKFIGQNLAVGAIDQSIGGYNRIWNTNGTNNSNWQRKSMLGNLAFITGADTRNYNYTVVSNDNGATITSDMKKLYAVTLQTEKGTTINVNGNNFTSPYSTNVVEVNKLYL
ncbi:MAG: hypothetical protein NTX22_07590, partial [Ignavibacteriales bacterium]|nr:hypothetical protein [Ignavibacteriales bacterium]